MAGIEFELPPKGETSPEESVDPHAQEIGPHPGWYAVSVALICAAASIPVPDGHGGYAWFTLNSFAYFQHFRPVAHAGWSIYIYHISWEECQKGPGTNRLESPELDRTEENADAEWRETGEPPPAAAATNTRGRRRVWDRRLDGRGAAWRRLAVVCLLSVHAGLLAYGAAVHSPVHRRGRPPGGRAEPLAARPASTSTTSTRRWSAW